MTAKVEEIAKQLGHSYENGLLLKNGKQYKIRWKTIQKNPMNEDGILANIPDDYVTRMPEVTPDRVREMIEQLQIIVGNPRAERYEYSNSQWRGWISYDPYLFTSKESISVDPSKCSCDNGIIKGKYEDEECDRCGGTGKL